jgi:cysteinyl-tRNA synthetase
MWLAIRRSLGSLLDAQQHDHHQWPEDGSVPGELSLPWMNCFSQASTTCWNKDYGPMTIRFFILQAHYRSTLDFSNEALQAAEKGFNRLLNAMAQLDELQPGTASTVDVDGLEERCNTSMADDMNTARLLGHLLGGVTQINNLAEGKETLTKGDLERLKSLYHSFVFSVLGLTHPQDTSRSDSLTGELVELILQLRNEAKVNRDFQTADRIRDGLSGLGITVKDRKDGADWAFK